MAIKTSTKHPYAAIEHRVIDSPAYASLTFSARGLLVLLTRQLTKDNNGHLQATHAYLQRFGFDAERTISRAVRELIATGLIYRTRCGGYQKGASQYAVTWLPVKDRQGLFLDGFKSCAWRDWMPESKKTPPAKIPSTHGKNGTLPPTPQAKNTARHPRKNTDNELVPCRAHISGHEDVAGESSDRVQPDDNSPSKQSGNVTELQTVSDHAGDNDDEPDDFQRDHDDDHQAGNWDSDLGEFIRPIIKQRMTGASIEQARQQIAGLQARRYA